LWYYNYEKQFALYPVSWVSQAIVRGDIGEGYFDFVIICKDKYFKCGAAFYSSQGVYEFSEKDKTTLSPELLDIVNDIKDAAICWHNHFYYDRKNIAT